MSDYTYDDMERFKAQAQAVIDEDKLGVWIERCVHPSVTNPVFWVRSDATQKQIGTFTVHRKIDGEDTYAASKIVGGVPYAFRERLPSFAAAVRFASTDIRGSAFKEERDAS